MQKLQLEKVSDLPQGQAGFSLVQCAVSDRGSGLFLFVEDAAKEAVHAVDRDNLASFPQARMEEAGRFLLIELAGEEVREVELPPLDLAFPLLDVFPDGRVLIAAARCALRGPDDYDRNGAIFDPRNGEVTRILLGDGIADLAIDARGRIWVSYFDEGVFGNYGWGRRGRAPLGAHGLNCFDDEGGSLWRFQAPGGFEEITDCYALNVQGTTAVICYYTDFPLCVISGAFECHCFATGLRGSRNLVVNGSNVLFTRQYEEPLSTARFGRLANGEVQDLQTAEIVLPDGSPISSGQLLGRGWALHYFDDSGWYRFQLLHRR